MVTWSDIQRWNPSALTSAGSSLRSLRTTLLTTCQDAEAAERAVLSRGLTVTQAREVLRGLTKKHTRLVNEVSELMMATVEAADGVGDVQTLVLECTQYAQTHPAILNADGSVTYQEEMVTSMDSAAEGGPTSVGLRNANRKHAADKLKELVAKALARAVEVDEAYGKRLDALTNGTYTCVETSTTHSPGLPNQPQAGWSPTQVAFWWASLTQAEKQAIITEHPEWIGNLDGIDMSSRSQANLNRLPTELAAAQAEYDRVKKEYDDWQKDHDDKKNSGGIVTSDSNPHASKLDTAKVKLADLNAINSRIDDNPEFSLLVLDTSGDDRVHAAVGYGDVDHAAHVGTFVPGMYSNPEESLSGEDDDLSAAMRLRQAAERQGANGNVATVMWLDYDAPPSPIRAASTHRAHMGAEALASFTEGINASRAASGGNEPHQTLLGHSYGSTTAGFAADHARAGVIDDLVLFGSPGSGVQDAREYNLGTGHAYVSAVDSHDWVQGMGPDGAFGKNPTGMPGMHHLSGDAPGTQGLNNVNPFARHSAYLAEGAPALEDMGAVIAGQGK